jgi:hypothetical protein
MKTLKYFAYSIIFTGLIYLLFTVESDSIDFREWTMTVKALFVLCTITVDLVLIESHKIATKKVTE